MTHKLGSKVHVYFLTCDFFPCRYILALELPTGSDLVFIKLRSAFTSKDNWSVLCYKNSLYVGFFHPYLSIR